MCLISRQKVQNKRTTITKPQQQLEVPRHSVREVAKEPERGELREAVKGLKRGLVRGVERSEVNVEERDLDRGVVRNRWTEESRGWWMKG